MVFNNGLIIQYLYVKSGSTSLNITLPINMKKLFACQICRVNNSSTGFGAPVVTSYTNTTILVNTVTNNPSYILIFNN